MRHGGNLLVDQLELHGVTALFTVPGESFLAVLDALHDSDKINTITCRHEGGAAMMAEAWGKMTAAPGVAIVTRGPGAANAMSGLHVAQQDSTPMILFVGLPVAGHEDREAFQEIEIKQLFSSFVKWAAVIRQPARIPEYVARAFQTALSGRPGPVVLGLPEDMLSAAAVADDAKPASIAYPAPQADDLAKLESALAIAVRPLMIVGGPGWSAEVQRRIEEFCARFDLPVAASFRCQDYIDNRHHCYAGHAGIGIDGTLAAAISKADLLIALGARLGEITTSGYKLVDIPEPAPFFIHVHPSADEIGPVYRADLPICASAKNFAAALATLKAPPEPPWRKWRQDLRSAATASRQPVETPGPVKMEQVVRTVSDIVPGDAIITNGAGNYAAFVHRYFQYKGYRSQLAPTSGSMGYGLPAAIAAQLAAPARTVVCFAGDGCFLMTGQELATAVRYKLPLVVIIANNAMYGTIRMHQERTYPGRVVGTDLNNPDFAALAQSFGAHGEAVDAMDQFEPALRRALAASGPAVIELAIDPEALTPLKTLSQISQAGTAGNVGKAAPDVS